MIILRPSLASRDRTVPSLLAMEEYKICVMGWGAVGKTCLTVQFVQRCYYDKYDPTVEDSYRVQREIDDRQVMFDILDTGSGYAGFIVTDDLSVKNSDGFILVYSVTSQRTLSDLPYFREMILRVKDSDTVLLVLVGNKCDDEERRVVSSDQGEQLAREWGCSFFESSAKTRHNVAEIFRDIYYQISRSSE